MENKKYKYIAFISYRHTKPDFQLASQIHQEIEKFKVPKELNKDGKYNELRVFRDREELTTKDLSESLDEALRESEYLIIVCSKRTPLSPWCTREVREFKKYHDDSKIIPILIEGEPYESFNEELTNLQSVEVDDKGNEIVKPLELLAADLRPDEVKNPNFVGYEKLESSNSKELDELTKKSIKILKSSEIYRIMATILGVNFGDLKQRHKERRLKKIITGAVASVLILLAFGISMTNLYFKAVAAEREATQQTSMMTLKTADNANERGDRGFALLVSDEAISHIEPQMNNYDELVANYNRILNDALLSPKYSTQQVLRTDSETPFYDYFKNKNWIVSGGELNTANIWNIENGEILKTLEFNAPVSAVDVTNDDSLIYIATKDGKLYKINAENYESEEIMTSGIISYTQIGTNKNGKYFFGLRGKKHVQVYESENFSLVSELIIEGDYSIKFISLLPDKDEYIVAYTNGAVLQYDMKSGKVIKEIEGEKDKNLYPNTAVNLSKNGKVFAYSQMDKITLYFLETGEKKEITNSVSFVNNLLLNKDGTKLFADSSSGINEWNTETLEFLRTYNYGNRRISHMAINSEEDKLVVAFSDNFSIGIFENINSTELNNADRKMQISPGSAHDENIIFVRFSDDGKYILTSSQDSTIKVISTTSTLSQESLKGKIKAISSNGDTLFLMDKENYISKYSFKEEKFEQLGQVKESLSTPLNVYAVSNKGEYFAFSDTVNSYALVFNSVGERLYTTKAYEFKNPFGVISDIEFSEKSNELFTLGEEGQIFITDIKTGEFKKELKDLEEYANKLTLSEDGSLVGIGYASGKTSIINVASGEVIEKIDGEVFIIKGENGKLQSLLGQYGKRFFEFSNGKTEYYASNEERKGISNLDFNYNFVSKDGNYLITTVSGKDTIVTDLKTGFRVRTLPTLGEISSRAVMSEDNKKIAYEYSEDETLIADFYTIEKLKEMGKESLGSRVLTDNEKSEIGILSRVKDE